MKVLPNTKPTVTLTALGLSIVGLWFYWLSLICHTPVLEKQHAPLLCVWFPPPCLFNSIMSSPSTTSYLPLDSDAPTVFRTYQITLCLAGERPISHCIFQHILTLLVSRIHSTASCRCMVCFRSWHMGSHQTLLLYDNVITLDKEVRCQCSLLILLLITFEMARSSGFGRLWSAFKPSGYTWSIAQRLRWRLPKVLFIFNRYILTALILYVTCDPCHLIHDNMLE